MLSESDISQLRARGIMQQKDKNLFIVRIGLCGGHTTPQQLRSCAALSEEFGDGTIHLTTRQTVEIDNIPADKVMSIPARMEQLGLPEAVSGSRLRTVVACPGSPVCRFNRGNTQELAKTIWQRFKDFSGLNCKIKISVTGCVNSCAKPQENDIGFMAAGDDKWAVFLGGKIGRQPQLAEKFCTVNNTQQALELLEKIFNWHRDNGATKERLATIINRLGKEKLLADLDLPASISLTQPTATS